MRAWKGRPYPLGAQWDGMGVNFAIFSANATRISLCLFNEKDDVAQSATIDLKERTNQVWHCYLPDARPGQLYAYRADGPYAPERGHRFNPAKLLLDPYARAISGPIRWDDTVFGYTVGGERADLDRDPRDSAAAMPKCVVIDSTFAWGDDRRLETPWNRTVIYEAHVKGMTMRHPAVPKALRGTYLGLCSDAVLDHLHSLGVTALELLPVHQFVDNRWLLDRGLRNYWGYNSIGFFAPEMRYASGGLGHQVDEFKTMVRVLHAAGIEVILDVVYNHTAEGNHLGPTFCFKGIDNAAYYRTRPGDARYYDDFTGTGNTLNMKHPRTLQLIADSLRYWVTEMHVDGFRFDLAPVMARQLFEVDRLSAFFDIIQQDPIIQSVKLIAEPWDVGPGGYQVGNFPPGWAEWNGKYRDHIRRLWKGDPGQLPDAAARLSGSADIYQWTQRAAFASVNFVAAHDGFTLHDLVSYEQKHNEANGENNADGSNANWSRNWGTEGETSDPAILDRRYRVMKDFMATLALSQGVPMIAHGDEIGRTQRGNNNVYPQDNALSWIDWDLDDRQRDLLAFTRRVFAVRADNPVLRRRTFFRGETIDHAGVKDLTWLRPDGTEMQREDWRPDARVLGMLVNGNATDETDERGRPICGDTMLLLLNAGDDEVEFRLPTFEQADDGERRESVWSQIVNTAGDHSGGLRRDSVMLPDHSLLLLRFGRDRRIATLG